jgi:hypothetical protein
MFSARSAQLQKRLTTRELTPRDVLTLINPLRFIYGRAELASPFIVRQLHHSKSIFIPSDEKPASFDSFCVQATLLKEQNVFNCMRLFMFYTLCYMMRLVSFDILNPLSCDELLKI